MSEAVDLGSKYKGQSDFKFLVKRKKSENEHWFGTSSKKSESEL